MRVSYAWLQELVDLDRSPEALAETLTMCGVEVGALDDWRGRRRGVVVGRITAIVPHPHADRLQLCTVDRGAGSHRVVCGADNIAVGQAVPLALLGACLPNGLTVEARTIRGVTSEGMLCSGIELQLGQDADGILVLPDDSRVGTPLADLLQLDDVILELDLTPNRPDCLSMVGVAREVAAVCNVPFRPPEVRVVEAGPPIDDRLRIDVEASDLCLRYYARLIEEVDLGPSPLWMQVRLLKLGVRPINNIVDITNYVLMERGQPLHAFDYDLLAAQRIVVRRAVPGERLATLDGVERELQADMLVIADGERGVAVAGVMGGRNSEVHDGTRRVLLESAYFAPTSIRRTAKQLGMHTEASHRFERGVDPNGAGLACDRAAQMLVDCAAGCLAQGAADVYPTPITPHMLRLRLPRLNLVLGTELSAAEVRGVLERLHLPLREAQREEFAVQAPTCRPDLTREIDLIEEVARLYGYDHVPTTLPVSPPAARSGPPHRSLEFRLRELLVGCGLAEAITYSFINPQWLQHLDFDADDPRAQSAPLSNPLSVEFSVLRTTLLPGILNCLRHNAARQQSDARLFECGTVFLPSARPKALPAHARPREERHLAVALTGKRQRPTWSAPNATVDLFDVKGVLEHLSGGFRVLSIELSPSQVPFMHPGRGLDIRCQEQLIGVLGEVRPEVLARFELPPGVFVIELHLLPFFEAAPSGPQFVELPRFPASNRDMAILVDEALPAIEVEAAIRRAAPNWLREVTFFDCFRGKTIPAGKKSLAYTLTFQADDRTLTDEMVQERYDAILDALARDFQATLRER